MEEVVLKKFKKQKSKRTFSLCKNDMIIYGRLTNEAFHELIHFHLLNSTYKIQSNIDKTQDRKTCIWLENSKSHRKKLLKLYETSIHIDKNIVTFQEYESINKSIRLSAIESPYVYYYNIKQKSKFEIYKIK